MSKYVISMLCVVGSVVLTVVFRALNVWEGLACLWVAGLTLLTHWLVDGCPRHILESAEVDEHAAVRQMHAAYERLKQLGYRDIRHAPAETQILMVELGSHGIHQGHATTMFEDKRAMYWAEEPNDMWPCNPVLFKEVLTKEKKDAAIAHKS